MLSSEVVKCLKYLPMTFLVFPKPFLKYCFVRSPGYVLLELSMETLEPPSNGANSKEATALLYCFLTRCTARGSLSISSFSKTTEVLLVIKKYQ